MHPFDPCQGFRNLPVDETRWHPRPRHHMNRQPKIAGGQQLAASRATGILRYEVGNSKTAQQIGFLGPVAGSSS